MTKVGTPPNPPLIPPLQDEAIAPDPETSSVECALTGSMQAIPAHSIDPVQARMDAPLRVADHAEVKVSAGRLAYLADELHEAMRGARSMIGMFRGQRTAPTERLFVALEQLPRAQTKQLFEIYRQRHRADPLEDLKNEHLLSAESLRRAEAYLLGHRELGDALGLYKAFDSGDAGTAIAILSGGTAERNRALMDTYARHYGRDLEYDLRGFAVDLRGPLDANGVSLTLRGLTGNALATAYRCLHGPRVAKNAELIAELCALKTTEARREIFDLLARAGGEERTLLAELFESQTGRDLVVELRPVFEAKERAPIASDPTKTVAVVVSSGNWKAILRGETDHHIGGYHWREVEAYVKEALDRGYTPVIFTPAGLPPSPDALSLLLAKLGPKLGFGLAAGTGPNDSPQGKAIREGFRAPRLLEDFDAARFATLHVAGGHGSHHDLVGNPAIERAAMAMHEQGKPVTAVCHATPSLGRLLAGGPATGFSPELDAIMTKAGYVLPEFQPAYDAHEGLVNAGAAFDLIDRAQAFANIHHTEVYERRGKPPVITGTGPEATGDVARIVFDRLAR